MATSENLKNDFLTCSVCIEVFQQPATLSCQHSFCTNCLKKYLQTQPEAISTKSIPCPTCKQMTPVPDPDRPVEEWAGQLKPGLLLKGLLDSCAQEIHQASVCSEEGETTPAAHLCSQREACFCDECIKLHRKMPSLRKHDVSKLPSDVSAPKLKKKFICTEHNKKMTLFCKVCIKPMCTVCCSTSHGMCRKICTLQAMLPDLKHQLQIRQQNISKKIHEASTEINALRSQVDHILDNTSAVKSEIQKIMQNSVNYLKQKETELLKAVQDHKDETTIHLKSKVKTREMEIQSYQQQSALIQQALTLENEAQLNEIYLSSRSRAAGEVTETQRENKINEIRFIHNLERLKEEIDKMKVKTADEMINLSATPVLIEVKNARSGNMQDILVMKVKDTDVTVITDCSEMRVKSYYTSIARPVTKQFAVDNFPWCLTDLSGGEVAVSILYSYSILILSVHPKIVLITTIKTNKHYCGLSAVDQFTLAASSLSPPSVDVLDMKGRVLRSIQTLPAPQNTFKDPRYIHVTKHGHILVSDSGLKSVICIKQTGDVVFTYTPTGHRALMDPHGITSTCTGDILVADRSTHKVSHLSRSGEFIRDILTSQDGLQCPVGLCVDKGKLYVADMNKGVLVYQFTHKPI